VNARNSDLAPGIAAAGSFLAFAYILGAGMLWLAAALAGVVYVAVRLLQPGTAGRAARSVGYTPPERTARDELRDMEAMGANIADRELRALLADVTGRARALLDYLERHPERSVEGRVMVGQFLRLSLEAVRLFAERSRTRIASSRRSREDLLNLLRDVSARFGALQDRINDEDDEALAGEIQVLSNTLAELDSVWQTPQEVRK
jgi:hypothetical protein